MKSLQAAGVITAQIKSYWLLRRKKTNKKKVLKLRSESQNRLIFRNRGVDGTLRACLMECVLVFCPFCCRIPYKTFLDGFCFSPSRGKFLVNMEHIMDNMGHKFSEFFKIQSFVPPCNVSH